MTPAERRGYKPGDKFIFTEGAKKLKAEVVRECTGFNHWDVFTLAIDTGTVAPVFTGDGCDYRHGPDGTPGAHIVLDFVQPFKE